MDLQISKEPTADTADFNKLSNTAEDQITKSGICSLYLKKLNSPLSLKLCEQEGKDWEEIDKLQKQAVPIFAA